MKRVSNKIKQHRGRLNVTQEAVAKKIGVSRVTIGKIENGSTPNLYTALLLADAFECSVDEIFSIETNK